MARSFGEDIGDIIRHVIRPWLNVLTTWVGLFKETIGQARNFGLGFVVTEGNLPFELPVPYCSFVRCLIKTAS